MKQALWIGLLIISVIGCNKSPKAEVKGPGPNAGEKPGPKPDDKITNVTDVSKCKGSTPSNTTVFGSWSADYKLGQETKHQTIEVENNALVNRLTCTLLGRSVTVEARANAAVVHEEIHILSRDQETHNYEDDKVKFPCSIALDKAVLTYSFQGPCLKLKEQAGEFLLVPGP